METKSLKPLVLALDDDESFCDLITKTFSNSYRVVTHTSPQLALQQLNSTRFDLMLLDMRLPGTSGLNVLRTAKTRCPELTVIMVSAVNELESAVQCMREGAADYVVKGSPKFSDELGLKMQKAFAHSELAKRYSDLEAKVAKSLEDVKIVGNSKAVLDVLSLVHNLSGQTRANVLITGPSGTGKELVAKKINRQEGVGRPFQAINCGAINKNLVQSELFGHKKGSFSSAVADHKGKFVAADGGDIFLDEVGDLAPEVQVSLLRVIQEQKITPVGDNKEIPVNVRIIAATHKDLKAEVAKGTFREDLFYRLAVFPIRVPSLKARSEDIPVLTDHLLKKESNGFGSVSEKARKMLQDFDWPGNIRQLESTLKRAWILASSDGRVEIRPGDITFESAESRSPEDLVISSKHLPRTEAEVTEERYEQYFGTAEKHFLKRALELIPNKSRLAEKLNKSRDYLYKRLRIYGLMPSAGTREAVEHDRN